MATFSPYSHCSVPCHRLTVHCILCSHRYGTLFCSSDLVNFFFFVITESFPGHNSFRELNIILVLRLDIVMVLGYGVVPYILVSYFRGRKSFEAGVNGRQLD